MIIKKDIELELKLTPDELAEGVWETSDEEQAVFLNKLGRYFYDAKSTGLIQLDYIIMNEKLDSNGKWLIEKLSDKLQEAQKFQ